MSLFDAVAVPRKAHRHRTSPLQVRSKLDSMWPGRCNITSTAAGIRGQVRLRTVREESDAQPTNLVRSVDDSR